jgi:uracil-DNA glycosylase
LIRLFESYDKLSQIVQRCKQCSLHEERTDVKMGSGYIEGTTLIVNNYSYTQRFEWDLHRILSLSSLCPKTFYITHSCKCCLPSNRKASKEARDTCRKFLLHQIKLLDPAVIVTIGKTVSKPVVKTIVSKKRIVITVSKDERELIKAFAFAQKSVMRIHRRHLEKDIKEWIEKGNF